MPHWKLTLTYDGTPFQGWQVQPNLATVQGTLAAAILRVTGERVLPQGSGRTDTGVHALAQVASFPLACSIPAANLQRALNDALPAAVRVLAAEAVPPTFHARHSAIAKTYEYRLFPAAAHIDPCSPMLAPFVWDCPLHLDLAALHRAAADVVGTHDFTSFAAVDPDQATRAGAPPPSAIRTITHSCWQQRDGLYIYRVTGTGFLHHMVRNLVGTFVEAARLPAHPRVSSEAVPTILAARSRAAAGPTAPARGLFLVSVEYPCPA